MPDRFTRADKHRATLREIAQRRRVYARLIADGRLRQDVADRQIAMMESIAADYAPPDLFGPRDV